MTTTLGEIHQDPQIIDRAIAAREQLDIVAEGAVQATLLPSAELLSSASRIGANRPEGFFSSAYSRPDDGRIGLEESMSNMDQSPDR